MNNSFVNPQKVSVRELQHKLSDYLEIVKNVPILVTKYGRDEAILINPKHYKITKLAPENKKKQDIMSSPFIGMHEHNKDWQNKSSIQIAAELRTKAWYGI